LLKTAFFHSEIFATIEAPKSVKAIMMTSAISSAARAYSEISMPLSFRERFLFLCALILLSFSIRQATLGER